MIKKILQAGYCTLLATNLGFSDLCYPDFMTSMTREGKDIAAFKEITHPLSLQNLKIFQSAYEHNILLAKEDHQELRIPKIVHQIWMGSPVPEKYRAWMKSWLDLLGWEYRLWTDEEIKPLLFYNQELYNRSKSYGEKTDIVRLELLLHYGGLYVDVDFECLDPSIFEELGKAFDFYVGFEPIEHGTINGIPKICNAIIAATPYHPIIKDLIVNMKPNWILHEEEMGIQKAGPDYFSRTILDYEKGILISPEKESDNLLYRNMYLPCTFFYPFSDPDIKKLPTHEQLLSEISLETAAIHYWSGSWRSPWVSSDF
jgi:mannosyltransferase OCH1-like enzyme